MTEWDDLDRSATAVAIARTIHELLRVEERWTVWHGAGFTWWPADHAQTFRVGLPRVVDGKTVWWASFETALLRGVPAADRAVRLTLIIEHKLECLYAVAVDSGRLVHRGRVATTAELVDSRLARLVESAMISNALAPSQAPRLAERLQRTVGDQAAVEIDTTAHPTAGRRDTPHAVMGVIGDFYQRPERNAEAPGSRPRLTELASRLASTGWKVEEGSNDDTLKVTGRGERLLFGVHLDLAARHPEVGSGMLSVLRIAVGNALSDERLQGIVEDLNEAEWEGHQALISLGAWMKRSADPSDPTTHGFAGMQLVHATFQSSLSLDGSAPSTSLADAVRRVAWFESRYL